MSQGICHATFDGRHHWTPISTSIDSDQKQRTTEYCRGCSAQRVVEVQLPRPKYTEGA